MIVASSAVSTVHTQNLDKVFLASLLLERQIIPTGYARYVKEEEKVVPFMPGAQSHFSSDCLGYR